MSVESFMLQKASVIHLVLVMEIMVNSTSNISSVVKARPGVSFIFIYGSIIINLNRKLMM